MLSVSSYCLNVLYTCIQVGFSPTYKNSNMVVFISWKDFLLHNTEILGNQQDLLLFMFRDTVSTVIMPTPKPLLKCVFCFFSAHKKLHFYSYSTEWRSVLFYFTELQSFTLNVWLKLQHRNNTRWWCVARSEQTC